MGGLCNFDVDRNRRMHVQIDLSVDLQGGFEVYTRTTRLSEFRNLARFNRCAYLGCVSMLCGERRICGEKSGLPFNQRKMHISLAKLTKKRGRNGECEDDTTVE
jgi:hypothetical protein